MEETGSLLLYFLAIFGGQYMQTIIWAGVGVVLCIVFAVIIILIMSHKHDDDDDEE